MRTLARWYSSACAQGIGLEGIDFGRMLRMLIVLSVSWRMLRGKFQICEKQVMSFNHSSLKCQESSLPKEGHYWVIRTFASFPMFLVHF